MARVLDQLFDPILRQFVTSFAYRATGGAALIAQPPSLVAGDSYVFNLYAPDDYDGWPAAPGRVGLVIPEPGAGSTDGVWMVGYSEDITAGPLVAGKRYVIHTFEAGDSFTNVGAGANATGAVFVASGTTPTTWTNGSVLRQVTTDLALDINASDFATAFNDLGVPGGTYTATGGEGAPIIALAGTPAVVLPFDIYTYNLYPQSNGRVKIIQTGNAANLRHQVEFSFKQAALALTSSFTNLPAGAADIDTLQVGATASPGPAANAIFSIGLTSYPYGGLQTLTFTTGVTGTTAPFQIGASASVVQSAIEGLAGVGVGQVIVRAGTKPNYYRVEFTGTKAATAIAAPTMAISGVTFCVGRQVTLDLDTVNMDAYIQGQRSVTAVLEMELNGDETPLQVPVQIINDGLDSASTSSTPTDTPLTTNSFAVLPAITGYTGGGASNMDGLNAGALGYPVGCVLLFPSLPSGDPRLYVVVASSAATAAPGIIRPANYAASTNEVVFKDLYS